MYIDWIRHGETKGNREGRYVGTTDEPLTEAGRTGAAALSLRLKTPQQVYVSPRKRCLETAALLFPGISPVVTEEFAECSFGAFEYKNYQELAGEEAYQRWIDSGGCCGFPGGEDLESFIRRSVKGFLRVCETAERSGAGRIALVVHGGTIMAVFSRLLLPRRDYFSWQCPNLTVFSTRYEAGEMRLLPPAAAEKDSGNCFEKR